MIKNKQKKNKCYEIFSSGWSSFENAFSRRYIKVYVSMAVPVKAASLFNSFSLMKKTQKWCMYFLRAWNERQTTTGELIIESNQPA